MSNEGQQSVGKGMLALGTLGVILLGVFAPLITWATKKDELQGKEKDIIRKMLNFEITLLIVCVLINFIPLIGLIICMILGVVNIVIAIIGYGALSNDKEFNPPMTYHFIK